jgi:dolichyl-phosphate-mannose--protein O-mannosyl transferase
MIAFAVSTADDYDFHSITTQIGKLSWQYNLSLTNVSCCLTVPLATRYFGAVIAGLAGDTVASGHWSILSSSQRLYKLVAFIAKPPSLS